MNPPAETISAAPTMSYTPPPAAPAPDRAPSLFRRLTERFALVAFALYHLPLFLNNYPSLGGGGFNEDGLAPRWGHLFTPPGMWVARHLFHLTGPMPSGLNGDNGDVAEEYARLFLAVVIALIGAVTWTIADRRRPRAVWVESTLRVLLRYSVALGLTSYAIAKILPQQFPPIALQTLEARVGDLSPMALLWTFMEYSRPYAFFGGLMELIAVVLLCFRRTASLGALLCVAVMTNVALLNYAYGVPVKLYATMITVSAAVLVLYDTRRLFDFFVRNRGVGPDRSSTWLQDHVPAGARLGIKLFAVGTVMLSSILAMAPTLDRAESTGTFGTWRVTTADSALAWRRLIVGPAGINIRTLRDSAIRCTSQHSQANGDAANVSLQCGKEPPAQLHLTAVQDTLRIEGTLGASPVHVMATRVTRESYNLFRSRFRWMFD